MALSLRRANAVKDALVRDGVPAPAILVIGKSETRPLVQTADGVREPQRRDRPPVGTVYILYGEAAPMDRLFLRQIFHQERKT
jgi:hypothetical protein